MKSEAANGLANFRDIGGWVVGQRTVRRGIAYRSAAIDRLDADGRSRLQALALRAVIDFRTSLERGITGAVAALPDVRIWHPANTVVRGAPQLEIQRFLKCAPGDISAMLELYRDIPQAQATGYTELFRTLAAGETPVLFHCAAGKDRTGCASAILLELLGVAREDILRDYLKSSEWLERIRADFLENFPDSAAILSQEDRWRSMLLCDPRYLDAMFEQVRVNYGDVGNYVSHGLKLGDQAVERIRARFLD